jgi:hypothetical protein
MSAAALVTYLVLVHTASTTSAFAGLKTRPYEIRFAYADAAAYRPSGAMLGTTGPAAERIPFAALHAFEQRGDKHALAIARAWNGEKPADVAEELRGLPQTSSVRSDHAAIELLTTSNENIESALAELEALRRDPDLSAARAARWNYAIVLSRLELPLSAAQAFREIADEHEAGWSDEARRRAEVQDELGRNARKRWEDASAAGQALQDTGALVPTRIAEQFPGLMRAYFYNAVRTAPDREHVQTLAPMADALDRVGGQPLLRAYVQRVADLDFHRRAPLASAYAQLLKGVGLDTAIKRELTTDTASPDVADVVMGAMVELDVVTEHLDAFRRMTRQAGDPWFEILLAQKEAVVAKARSDWFGSEDRLRNAQKFCGPAVHYRCLAVAVDLAHLYQDLLRIPEALTVLRDGLRTARSSGEWGQYRALLERLADVERFNSSIATARVYANEVLLTAPEPGRHNSFAHGIFVDVAIRRLDGRAARRALDLALRGTPLDLATVNEFADIGRLDPQPGDLAQLQGWLTQLRASGALTPAELVLCDEIEGRLLIESDRAAGTAVLERAIASTGSAPRDPFAATARAGAYYALDLDAARHGDHARVLALTAAQLGLPAPGPCTVAMLAEDERAAIAVRGSDGQIRGMYQPRRGRDDAVIVPAELARGLEACPHVGVMAHAALQGQPRILPATLPWSYLTGAQGRASPATTPPEPRAVIVANVNPPAYLQLAALSPWREDQMPATAALSGAAATPTRVLAEIQDATEIHFHTHALVNAGISDASHLVLSPGSAKEGYALTAEMIRGTKLRGHPVVVLAACHSAQGAHYHHTPWSLPGAFVAVGARAVFAAGSNIPDLEAGPFFTRVLDQIRAGAEPARVLRDERLRAKPSSWIADVILFE